MSDTDLRVPASQIAGVPQSGKPWKSVERATRALAACAPEDETNFLRSLTPGQRALIAVGQLSAEVFNGGFGQYFWNSGCRIADEALNGLKRVGANEHAKLLQEVIAAGNLTKEDFRDKKARRAKLKRLRFQSFFKDFDTRFYDLEENPKGNLNKHVQLYYQAHRSEFHVSDQDHIRQLERDIELRRTKEYKIRKPKGRIKREEFTWKLIEKLWDDYWEELKAGKERFSQLLSCVSPGQRAVIAVDLLNKSILQLGGVAGFVADTTRSEMLCEEVRRGYFLFGAKPYELLWSEWLSKANNLVRIATAYEQVRERHATVRDTLGKHAATELGKQFMQRNSELCQERERLRGEAEKIDKAFKKLLRNERTAIEVFILNYVEEHRDEFYIR